MLRFELMKAAGYFCRETSGHPSEYVPYYRHRDDLVELFGGPWLAGETRGEYKAWLGMLDHHERTLAGKASGKIPIEFERSEKSVEFTADIMNAHLTGKPFSFMGNVMNQGFITDFPADCCVEVPTFVDRSGFHPTHVGALPKVCAALCRSNISVQELAVEAALHGDHEAAYHASQPSGGNELSSQRRLRI